MVESNLETVSVEKCGITKQENFVSGRLAIRRTKGGFSFIYKEG
jgi:hypothetical protein